MLNIKLAKIKRTIKIIHNCNVNVASENNPLNANTQNVNPNTISVNKIFLLKLNGFDIL